MPAHELDDDDLALVRHVVGHLARRLPPHVEAEDLMQEWVIGLLDARGRYDPARDAAFKTFAEFRVRGAIRDYLRALDFAPRRIRARERAIEAKEHEVAQRFGRRPEAEEVADALGWSAERLRAERVAGQTALIPWPENEVGDPLEVAAEPADPGDGIDETRLRERIVDALERLPEQDRFVVTMAFWGDLPLGACGAILGVTESRACQIMDRALRRLAVILRGVAA